MTRADLLDKLTEFTQYVVKEIKMPVKMQPDDTEQTTRAAEVYKMRLPDSKSAKKKAPYIIHTLITSGDKQDSGQEVESKTTVRSIFCVYCEDEQEGGLMLVNLVERLRIELLRRVVLDGFYELDLQEGLETLFYPDDTAPYFMGEMVSVWKLPAVQREVKELRID